MRNKNLLVVLPTYNEYENLKLMVQQVLSCNRGHDFNVSMVVVDDNSPDGTGNLADELAKEYGNLFVVHREGKLGLGTAYVCGFKFGIEKGYDYIMTMDADFSHDPKYIPDIVRKMQDNDFVIGSRYVSGGGTVNWSLKRKVISRGANTYARVFLGLGINDCTSGFRCYKRELLSKIDLSQVYSSGYSFLVEMLYRCKRAGATIGESPIIFKDRVYGETKISREEMKKALKTVLFFALDRFGISKQKHF